MDANTGKGLGSASVYINNTTQGTVSKEDGTFAFSSNIAVGELIVTRVGYQTVTWPFNTPKPQNLLVKMEAKDNSLEEVLIVTDETRRRYLKLFKENFLGITDEANNSKILNLKDIYFVKNADKSDGFTARADSTLIIINKKTGYKVSFTLENFLFNFEQNMTQFYGYSRYEDLVPFHKKYRSNRQKIYEGSTMHFFRTLADTAVSEKDFYMLEISAGKASNGRDIEVMTARDRSYLIKKDSANPQIFKLVFKKKLRVHYNNTTSTYKFLMKEHMLGVGYSGIAVTVLNLIDDAIYFTKDGVALNPLGLLYGGYWSFEKAANMLPADFRPDEKLN